MLIHTEQTPNPATRKFLPGQTVMEAGTRDFADAESAEASPLASALFDSSMIEGVFFGRDFVSVTAAPGVTWSDLEPVVVETLLDHFVTGAPLFAPGTAGGMHIADEPAAIEDDPADADLIDQIKANGELAKIHEKWMKLPLPSSFPDSMEGVPFTVS